MHLTAPLAVSILAILLAFTGPAAAQVTGWAVPIDGDTIEIAGEHVRLHGIDAPESDQEWYRTEPRLIETTAAAAVPPRAPQAAP